MSDPEPAVAARLAELGIAYERHEHPAVATVEEAQKYWAGIDAAHCKNLFLRNQKGNRHYLVVLLHSKRADLAVGIGRHDLHRAAGAGAVAVLYGSYKGLRAAGNQLWTRTSPGISGRAATGDHFGHAVA